MDNQILKALGKNISSKIKGTQILKITTSEKDSYLGLLKMKKPLQEANEKPNLTFLVRAFFENKGYEIKYGKFFQVEKENKQYFMNVFIREDYYITIVEMK